MNEKIENIAQLDYESVQSEKRDKLNARLQIWSLFAALVSGFGLVSVQTGNVSYVVALFPFLATCIARYASHSEAILDQVKTYLLKVEQESGYNGYETFNRTRKRRASGSHKKALRDALVLTELLAIAVLEPKVAALSMPLMFVLILVVELPCVMATVLFLSERKEQTHE